MVTVKEMLLVLEELKMKEHVWLSVKDHLESFLPEGTTSHPLCIDGVIIPQSAVIDVLGDIDQSCLDPIRERINRIEGSKVNESARKEQQGTDEGRPKRRVGRPRKNKEEPKAEKKRGAKA